MQTSSIETIEALKQLGFVPDADGFNLAYDFGNFKLKAFQSVNRMLVKVVFVTGVYYDGRIVSDVQIQMPLHVASIELCAAFIASGIERQISKNFTPLIQTDWLETGRNNFDLLPWVKELKRYNERPKCSVGRDWLKLALRDLRLLLEELPENILLSLTFQNGIFSIRSPLKVIAFPATGEDWKEDYKIESQKLARFPKRLAQSEIEISIWENCICLAGWRYPLKINEI